MDQETVTLPISLSKSREQCNENPPRVVYSLTPKGTDLLPVFYAISQWGMNDIP